MQLIVAKEIIFHSPLAWSTRFNYIRDNFTGSGNNKPAIVYTVAGFLLADIDHAE